MISYAHTLKNLRKGHNLTQSEVADILGIDRSTYAYYERGTTKPDFECIFKICKMYGIDLIDIANMFLSDEETVFSFKSFDNVEYDKEILLNDLDMLNIDEYEKLILYYYRHISEEYKKLFFVKIKQNYDEITNLDNKQ